MPPYRGDDSPAWGLHFGAPSPAPASLRFLDILIGTGFDPDNCGWVFFQGGALTGSSPDFGGAIPDPFGGVYVDHRIVGEFGFLLQPANFGFPPFPSPAAWQAANAANSIEVGNAGAPVVLPIPAAQQSGSALVWRIVDFPIIDTIWVAPGDVGQTYTVNLVPT